jgi:hypothetical protein
MARTTTRTERTRTETTTEPDALDTGGGEVAKETVVERTTTRERKEKRGTTIVVTN